MSKKISVVAILVGFLFSLSAPLLAKNDGSLQIKGSDTMVNLVQAWAEKYGEKSADAFIAVTGGGSGTGFASLISGTCDIAMTSREITAAEIQKAQAKGTEPKEYKVALDGLAVVVHKNNPIGQLTIDQLSDIFGGKITNWKEVGGPDLHIVVLSREVNSGTHVYFKEHVLRKGDPKAPIEFSPDALMLPSSQAIADEVWNNTTAIGYYGMGYISDNQKAISIAKDASSEYFFPTIENVMSGAYPISRPLFLYTKGEPAGQVKEFMDYILSTEGQAIVKEIDFVPIKG